jgi:hypothetical protein
MTTAAKRKRLKELTKERVAQESRIFKIQNEIAKLEGQLSKKKGQLNAIVQQLSYTNNKLETLANEIYAENIASNKEY